MIAFPPSVFGQIQWERTQESIKERVARFKQMYHERAQNDAASLPDVAIYIRSWQECNKDAQSCQLTVRENRCLDHDCTQTEKKQWFHSSQYYPDKYGQDGAFLKDEDSQNIATHSTPNDENEISTIAISMALCDPVCISVDGDDL